MASSLYKDVDGLRVRKTIPDDIVRSALQYRPQPGDLFIVSYPKCGTTWMQHIVYNIINDHPPPQNHLEIMIEMPYLELQGAEAVQNMKRPGPIKTHMTFRFPLYSKEAKYIYVARNPYDCCVSFFYHARNIVECGLEGGTFGQFFEMFIEGQLVSGDYLDHLLSWYEHRTEPNVLFITYEELKKDTCACVLRIADFIAKEYGRKLRTNAVLLESVLSNTKLENMKERIDLSMKSFATYVEALPPAKVPEWFTHLTKDTRIRPYNKMNTGDFIRKGIVGDWRNHFSGDQVKRLKKKIEEKTGSSDVMSLWTIEDIP